MVTHRVVTVSRTRRASIRGAASSLEASTAARRPKPSGAVRRGTVSSPRAPAPGVHVGQHALCRQNEAYPEGALRPGSTSGPVRPPVDSPIVLMVGLTGGIGSGKSTVAGILVKRGAVVIDADAIARMVVEPGKPALAALAEAFGPEILHPDGSLDRSALAERVRHRRDAQAARGDHPSGDRRGVLRPDRGRSRRRDRRARRAAARGVDARLRLRRGDRGGGADRGALGAPRGAGSAPCRRRTADGAAGIRRGAARGGDVGARQLRRCRAPRAPDRRDLARAREARLPRARPRRREGLRVSVR